MDKWREMDNVWKAVEQDGDARMMALGIKTSVAHHLVGMAVKGPNSGCHLERAASDINQFLAPTIF